MLIQLRRAAVFAALLFGAAAGMLRAQDVTLTSRNGALAIDGTIITYDGQYYRVLTPYGPMTVDAQGVICGGPGCPDLTAPKAVIRLVGDADAGRSLIAPLFAAFAESRGLQFMPAQGSDAPVRLLDPSTGKVRAEIFFRALPPDGARLAVEGDRAEMMLSAVTLDELSSRALALDALQPIVAPDNPTPRLSTADLVRVLKGEIKNWSELGGPDMPLVLHALPPQSDLQRALATRLGQPVMASVTHPDLDSLVRAVVRDPWALAVTGRTHIGGARPITLTDSCGFPLDPTPLAVKAEDYPLTLPVFLLTPKRRLPLMAREFLEFLANPAADAAVASAGYVNRAPERHALAEDGLRLINAIRGAGEETGLADLKRLTTAIEGADRLSLTFRFEDGSARLDAHSRDNLADLARMISAGMLDGQTLILAGFSDGSGAAEANRKLSEERAWAVRDALVAAAPDMPDALLPQIEAFGEALPMACDNTAAGRRLNRRVELWLRPAVLGATDTQPSEN